MEGLRLLTGTEMINDEKYERFTEWINNSNDSGSKGHSCALDLLEQYGAMALENERLKKRVLRLEQRIYELSD
tara:strand:- start:1056 stop:1274 length:219 start_codon:yes stop_codon:yes gene_type:complete